MSEADHFVADSQQKHRDWGGEGRGGGAKKFCVRAVGNNARPF